MGFLDRFSKDTATAPDAFTTEVVARIRALPNVETAQAIDADTVSVSWSGWSDAEAVDISGPRQPWKQAKGFDRIEVLDGFIDGLAPGQYPSADPEPAEDPGAEAAVPPPPPPPPLPQRRPAARAEPAQTAPTEAEPAQTEPVTEWSQVAAQLVPVVRRVRPGDAAVTWPIGDLLEATAIWAGGATPVTGEQCATWGVGLDDVRSAAIANLVAIDPAPDAVAPDTRAWVPTSPEGLQSSWLTAPGPLLNKVGLTTGVVLVPLRSELVVVDPADADLVRSILTNTLAILESQTAILCPVPFLVTADRVESWQPPPDHPAAPLVRQTRDMLQA